MATVELVGIGKSYGTVDVIRKIDLQLPDEGLTVLVGPSGCGKSTLLRMIAGLEKASRGDILIDGAKVNDATPTDRGVAMVFQNYALYPHMTVRQNVGFPLRMAGVPRREITARVAAAADSLRLAPLLDRKPAQLSGGQRQRVAIGRAIVRQPHVFLFDEPLSNLDAELRVQMRLEIARLHKSLATTMIYVTHDQTEAMTLADRIVVMRAGHVEQVGTPTDLYSDPANTFVAGFIGSPRMNFLDAEVVRTNMDGVTVRLDDFGRHEIDIPLREPPPDIGAKVSVGLRPERFQPGGSVGLEASVDVVENLGSTNYVYARGPAGQALTVEFRDMANVDRTNPPIRFNPADLLLFSSGGKRLR